MHSLLWWHQLFSLHSQSELLGLLRSILLREWEAGAGLLCRGQLLAADTQA
jgi:hypothetical protein